MTVSCTGKITYIGLVEKNNKVKLHIQGTTKITKGAFDWFGAVGWKTRWDFFNPYGKLIYRDDRSHSIAPFTKYDEGIDDFKVSLPKWDYYNIQLYGPCVEVLDTQTFDISEPPVVAPPPVFPPPVVVPPPPPPEDELPPPPDEEDEEEKFPWVPVAIGGGIAVIGLLVAATREKK